jgi:mono/diheme cytochrome c family protein
MTHPLRSRLSSRAGRSGRRALVAACMAFAAAGLVVATHSVAMAQSTAPAASAPAAVAPAAGAGTGYTAADGAALFGTVGCSDCHGAQGQGDFGPRLVGSAQTTDPKSLVNRILFGGGAMPGLGDQLSDLQIAAVVNYVRTTLNTYTDTITPDVVTAIRSQK